MNSTKREKQDSRIDHHTAVIRSHRRTRHSSTLSGLFVMALVASLACGISIVVVRHAASDAPATHTFSSPRIPVAAPDSSDLAGVVPDKVADAQDHAREERGKAAIEGYRLHLAQQMRASKIEAVIAYALAQQGDRYVFGADGPTTFDCSGLVLAAFRQIGMELYHYTGVMITKGTPVSRDGLQRGDIIFPSYQHVAIYLVGGMQVAARH